MGKCSMTASVQPCYTAVKPGYVSPVSPWLTMAVQKRYIDDLLDLWCKPLRRCSHGDPVCKVWDSGRSSCPQKQTAEVAWPCYSCFILDQLNNIPCSRRRKRPRKSWSDSIRTDINTWVGQHVIIYCKMLAYNTRNLFFNHFSYADNYRKQCNKRRNCVW